MAIGPVTGRGSQGYRSGSGRGKSLIMPTHLEIHKYSIKLVLVGVVAVDEW